MKTKLITIFMILAFLAAGCSMIHFGVKEQQLTEIAAGGLASYLGYEGYRASPETFDVAYQIATGELDLNAKINALRNQLTDEITTHPVLKETAKDLLNTIEVDVTVDVIEIAPGQEGLVGAMIQKFARGIELAKMEV